jgi:2,3-bisphosphoglycerate-independent phosphoglycerate mutase
MPEKCILILLDGLGDRTYASLLHRTPLQAARTPVMDRISSEGANGIYHAQEIGLALPSENAHFALFGYDMKEFPGRGALVALGAGVDFSAGDVGILAHFANVFEKNKILYMGDEKAPGSESEANLLTETIAEFETENIRIHFYPFQGLRGVLTLRGKVSRHITDTNDMINGIPLCEVLPWDTHKNDPAAQRTARALKKYLTWVYHTLATHPVNFDRKARDLLPLNCLVTQRAGKLGKVVPFEERFGLKGLSIASNNIFGGLARYLGMDFMMVSDSENPGEDLAKRITTAVSLLDKYDFFHVHTKAPDEAGHQKNPILKKEIIELLDEGIGQVIEELSSHPEILLVLTADHSTPSSGPLVHSGETVPVVFRGEGIRRDTVCCFDEISASGGSLSCLRGPEIMYLIVNHLDRSKLMGIMDTPFDQFFWPGNFQPFRLK